MNDIHVLWLPLAVTALAVVALLVDALAAPTREVPGRSAVGLVVALGLGAILAATWVVDANGRAAHDAYEVSGWTLFLQRLFLTAGLLGALGAMDDVAARTPRRQGEYFTALLFCLAGMVTLPGARDLVLLVVSFELMSIPLYVLAAFAKTDAPLEARGHASEAALKLYLVGATSTAITLFGLALTTGMAGTTRLAELGVAPMSPLEAVGIGLVLAGLGYKVGMVPFHMWVPDTYEGARAPFVAFLSVAPKAAGVAAIVQVFLFGLAAHRAQWLPALGGVAFLSMGVGNLLALPQTDLRRLLGYSGIAQMGYVLVGVATSDSFGVGMVLFFLAAYVFTNLGAFLVVHAVAEAGGGFGFEGLYGLAGRSPGLAASLLGFVLSLAGIPFAVGFWAKLYVLFAAWRSGLHGLVAAAIVLAVLGLFYYLRVLRAAYMTDAGELATPRPGWPLKVAIAACAVGVVGFGLWPRPLVEASVEGARALLGAPAVVARSELPGM